MTRNAPLPPVTPETPEPASDLEAARVAPERGGGEAVAVAAASLKVVVLGGAPAQRLPALRTFRAQGAEGQAVALVTLEPDVTEGEREQFAGALAALQMAGEALAGNLPVRDVADGNDAFVTDLWTTGTARDLSALKWPLHKRLAFVAGVARGLDSLHAAGLSHGCLCADNVLLDDDLRPVLSEGALVDVRALLARRQAAVYEPYLAPETRNGGHPTPAGDIYAAGKLLTAITAVGETLPTKVGEIVQRCVSPPMGRYASARELAEILESTAAALAQIEAVARRPSETRPPPGSLRPDRTSIAGPASGSYARPTVAWTPPAWLRYAGLGLVVTAFAAGALVGGASDALRALFAAALLLGAALTTTAAPAMPRARTAARIALAVGVAGLVLVADPLSLVYRLAARRELGAGEEARAKAIDDLLRMGRDLRGISLAGADLSGRDLTGADLRGVNLSGANLADARLVATEVDGTNFDGAVLAGADLSATQLKLANLGSARCDAATRLPPGFKCDGARIARNQPPPAP